MLTKLFTPFTLLTVLTLCVSPALADHDDDDDGGNDNDRNKGWVKLGEQQVDFKSEEDTIQVGKSEGRFTKIRIEVDDGDLVMEKIRVHFANGDTFAPEVKHKFKEGDRTRDIDLPGDERHITKVTFRYHSERGGDKATVKLYGREKGK
jgi:hypothetical protein